MRMVRSGVVWAVIFSGCATYRAGNETFYSSIDALERQNEINSRLLSEITPIDNPIHGTALVLIPSDVEIRKNYIRFSGIASYLDEDHIAYLISTSKNNFRVVADAIQKRGIFNKTLVEHHNGNPASIPIGEYDYLIFADVDGWFIKGKDTMKASEVASSLEAPVVAFLNSLYLQATALKTK